MRLSTGCAPPVFWIRRHPAGDEDHRQRQQDRQDDQRLDFNRQALVLAERARRRWARPPPAKIAGGIRGSLAGRPQPPAI